MFLALLDLRSLERAGFRTRRLDGSVSRRERAGERIVGLVQVRLRLSAHLNSAESRFLLHRVRSDRRGGVNARSLRRRGRGARERRFARRSHGERERHRRRERHLSERFVFTGARAHGDGRAASLRTINHSRQSLFHLSRVAHRPSSPRPSSSLFVSSTPGRESHSRSRSRSITARAFAPRLAWSASRARAPRWSRKSSSSSYSSSRSSSRPDVSPRVVPPRHQSNRSVSLRVSGPVDSRSDSTFDLGVVHRGGECARARVRMRAHSFSSDDAIGAKRRGRDSDRIMCRVLDDYIVAARRGEAPGRLRGNRREPRRERLTSTTRGTGPMKLDPPAACTESQGSGRVWNPLSSVFWTWPGKSSWTSWRRPGWTSSPCRWTSSCRWSSWRRWSSWPWSKSSSWTQPGW